MDRPILVTGGTGFIGRHLVSRLCAEGLRVRALARRPQDARALQQLGAEPVVGDLLDPPALPGLVAGVGAVFHLAGRLFAPGIPSHAYERLHVDGTVALLRACEGLDRLDGFVLCSTTGVHGSTGLRTAREDDPPCPGNPYEATKARAEAAATAWAQRAGVPLAIARPSLVYGPGDRHVLGLFRAIRGGYYRVIGSGRNRVHPIYVDDVVEGLLRTAGSGPSGRAYHLVGPRPVSMRELSDAIGAAVGRSVSRMHLPVPLAYAAGAVLEAMPVPRRLLPLSRSRVRFMTQSRAYDGSRAAEELGFVPAVDLDEGLAKTVAWYRRHGWL